jgi:type II restriction enzyme
MNIKVTDNVPSKVAENIRIVLGILKEVGIPVDQLKTDLRKQRMAEACLAIGSIINSLSEAKSVKDKIFRRSRDIIKFEKDNYGEKMSSGSYDDIRRKDLKLLVLGNIAINSSSIESKATNDSTRAYSLSDEFAALLREYGKPTWDSALTNYKNKVKALEEELQRKREAERVPVTLPSGEKLLLSYGEHNQLQKAIIENFLELFGHGCEVLYVGDTSDKLLHKDEEVLKELGFFDLEHDELPDVVAYNKQNNILFLVEAFHCTGQWDNARLYKIQNKLTNCKANVVYVTAFETFAQFKTYSATIAWETEVWIAEIPEHMIHFNGWKFLEIHKKK